MGDKKLKLKDGNPSLATYNFYLYLVFKDTKIKFFIFFPDTLRPLETVI